jgi:hypothetical protein
VATNASSPVARARRRRRRPFGRWGQLTLADIFGFIHEVVERPALSPAQIDWAVAEGVNEGLPAEGWVVRMDKTVGEGSKNPNLANGKGLDHLADVYGQQIVGIYFQALAGCRSLKISCSGHAGPGRGRLLGLQQVLPDRSGYGLLPAVSARPAPMPPGSTVHPLRSTY